MVCVYCGSETEVKNSRHQKRNNQVWRRRQCKSCRAIFTTHEVVDLVSTLLVESKGSVKPFLPDLLFTEVLLALQDRKDAYVAAREVSNTVVKQLLKLPEKPTFTSVKISAITGQVLKRLEHRAWLRYVAEHPSLQ